MTQQDVVVSGRCDASGNGRLKLRTVGRETWSIQQVSHNGRIAGATAVGASAQCGLYKNGVLISPTVAQGSVIAGDPPVTLRGQDLLELVYSGAAAFAGIEMLVIYDDGLRG